MIENFKETRRDGKTIAEGSSIESIKSLGKTSRVVKIEWDYDGNKIVRTNQHGIFAKILPQRNGLLCLEFLDEKGDSTSLIVLNADGSVRFEVPSSVEILESARTVRFMYTSPNLGNNNTAFGVVVDVPSLDAQYRLIIDSSSGEIIECYYTR